MDDEQYLSAELNGRVLLVEDNPINQMIAQKMLEKVGVESTLAGDGQQALNMLAKDSFDAVLMDCQMPVLDGYQAAEIIRNTPSPYQNIPIIALTANVMAGDKERCLRAGMNDYLAKPLEPGELYNMIKHWLALAGVAV